MCRGLIGKKLGMTGYYTSDGRYVPVTAVQVGPCVVTQIKTEATDGYNALQLSFEEVKRSRVNKPAAGHFKKSGDRVFKFMREFAVEDPAAYTLGQVLTVELFEEGQRVDVTGTTKGRGFAGVIKRHGFHGGRKTHGSDAQRIPGSIGASAWPSRVFKGKKLPGHYGHTRQTTKNLMIVDIRPESNLVLIKGALPGAVSGLLEIKKPKSAN